MAQNSSSLKVHGCKSRLGCVSLDCGGSLAKIAYVPNKGQDAAADTIHFTTVPLSHQEEIVELIKQNCDLLPNDEGQKVISVTGAGMFRMWRYLENNLEAKLSMHDEMSMSVRGFKHLLQNLGPGEFLEPYADEAIEEAMKEQIPTSAALLMVMGQKLPQVDETAPPRVRMEGVFKVNLDVPKDLSKYMLLSLGSGAVSIKVDGDQVAPFIDVMTGVGKTFFALGKLITGKQSYQELLELAERGNSQNVNTLMGDMVSSESEGPDGFYRLISHDMVTFFLGKVADSTKSREDFLPEDLMAGLLEETCCNIIQRCYNVALANDVQTVFFMGGFVDSPVVRRVLTRYALLCMMKEPKKINFHIAKYASYVEVMGCLLSPAETKEESPKQSETATES